MRGIVSVARRGHLKWWSGGVLSAVAIGVTFGAAFVWSGIYDIGSDVPHWGITSQIINMARERSIARRAGEITRMPNLSDATLVSTGAGQYAAMCEGCHLGPGVKKNDLQAGLYPRPPALFTNRLDPRYAFVAIKHGIKMTGMPAWGQDHDDEAIWSLVAFVNQLPGMNEQKYNELLRAAPADEEMGGAAGKHDMKPTPRPKD